MSPKKKTVLQCKMSIQTKKLDQQKMTAAIEGMGSKVFTLGKASKIFGIPKSTLSDKVNGKQPVKKTIKTILTFEEERKLANWLISLVQNGCKNPKRQLLQQVQKILNNEGRETVFSNNFPGNKWYYAFLRRQGIVSLRQEIENQPDLSQVAETELSTNQPGLSALLRAVEEPVASSETTPSEEHIEAATGDVPTKSCTLEKSAKIYGIPKSTLSSKVHEKYPLGKRCKTILTSEEEHKLAQWLVTIIRKGCKFPKQQLLQQVQKILNDEKRETIFPNNLPGNKWYYAFLKRQGILSLYKDDTLKEPSELLPEKVCPRLKPEIPDQQTHLDDLLDTIQQIPADKLSDYRNKLIDGRHCDEPEFVRFSFLYRSLSAILESKVGHFSSSQGEVKENKIAIGSCGAIS